MIADKCETKTLISILALIYSMILLPMRSREKCWLTLQSQRKLRKKETTKHLLLTLSGLGYVGFQNPRVSNEVLHPL